MRTRLLSFALLLAVAIPAPAEDKKADNIETLYKALQLTPGEAENKGVFKVGERVKIKFGLKNAGKVDLIPPERVVRVGGKPTEARGIGTVQSWVERLGSEPTISAYPKQYSRNGRMYAAGGTIYTAPATIKAGDTLPITFGPGLPSTKDFPPGKYKAVMEWKDLNEKVLDTKSVEFELK